MSSVLWDGDNLIQKVGPHVEQLGHVKPDENAGTYVLWLKDTRAVFGPANAYIRGDTFPSMKEAKQRAAISVSASLFHYMWLAGLRDGAQQANATHAPHIVHWLDPAQGSCQYAEADKRHQPGHLRVGPILLQGPYPQALPPA